MECPGSHDIVFRQGKTMMKHPGNVMFRDLILNYLEKQKEWNGARQQSLVMNGGEDVDDKHDNDDDTVSYGKQHFKNSLIFHEV